MLLSALRIRVHDERRLDAVERLVIRATSFDGADAAEVAAPVRVLRGAAERLTSRIARGGNRDDLAPRI